MANVLPALQLEQIDRERLLRALQRERDSVERQSKSSTALPFIRDELRREVVELDKLSARLSVMK